ncbi:antibiotic biosynthesis monooxygenase family protein [Streptomyces sp. NPDC050145]|uniref:antibiotic biosynthesis monooxygenase family protein n=1 Tax=Streptomyces sp. NPDC050145 TaxID=3365602 RepID=UPI0037B5A681
MQKFTMLTLRPAPGRADDLIAYYREAGVLEASGALSAQVLVPDDDPGTVVVTALWAGPAAYTAWQNSPERLEFGRGLAPFLGSSDSAHTREFQVGHGHVPVT